MGLKKCDLFFNVNPRPVEKMLVHSNLLLVSCGKRSQATLGLICAAGLVRMGVALHGRRISSPVKIWACKVPKCTGRYPIGCKHANRIRVYTCHASCLHYELPSSLVGATLKKLSDALGVAHSRLGNSIPSELGAYKYSVACSRYRTYIRNRPPIPQRF